MDTIVRNVTSLSLSLLSNLDSPSRLCWVWSDSLRSWSWRWKGGTRPGPGKPTGSIRLTIILCRQTPLWTIQPGTTRLLSQLYFEGKLFSKDRQQQYNSTQKLWQTDGLFAGLYCCCSDQNGFAVEINWLFSTISTFLQRHLLDSTISRTQSYQRILSGFSLCRKYNIYIFFFNENWCECERRILLSKKIT